MMSPGVVRDLKDVDDDDDHFAIYFVLKYNDHRLKKNHILFISAIFVVTMTPNLIFVFDKPMSLLSTYIPENLIHFHLKRDPYATCILRTSTRSVSEIACTTICFTVLECHTKFHSSR